LEKVCDAVPNYDMETVIRDFNAKFRKVPYLYPAYGWHCLHNETNDNGKLMANFAMGRDLDVTGTWYQHKDFHKVNWRSRDNT
jgi:hypothetical protein